MSFLSWSKSCGHHEYLLNGPSGLIELGLSIPEYANYEYFAIVGHPHPLQEGTMNNKVVTTTAKALFFANIPVIRFNFRGVGKSQGEFDNGHGETEDMLYLIHEWRKIYPHAKLLLAGFSFGSFIAFKAAQLTQVLGLLLIAPPVFRFDFKLEQLKFVPDLILMGDNDEVVSPKDVKDFADSCSPEIEIKWFEDTGHFFHGKLIILREAVESWINLCLAKN